MLRGTKTATLMPVHGLARRVEHRLQQVSLVVGQDNRVRHVPHGDDGSFPRSGREPNKSRSGVRNQPDRPPCGGVPGASLARLAVDPLSNDVGMPVVAREFPNQLGQPSDAAAAIDVSAASCAISARVRLVPCQVEVVEPPQVGLGGG